MEPLFTGESIHNLSVHQEFKKNFLYASRCRHIFHILGCFIVLWYISLFQNQRVLFIYLALELFLLISHLLQNSRKGDIQYKRMLQLNEGEPLHMQYRFCDDAIYVLNPKSGNRNTYRYEMFRYVINAPHMLILVMEHKSCLILEKQWLQGGTPDEFLHFFLHRCPNLKKKKAKGVTFGKWTQRLLIILAAIGTVIALFHLTGLAPFGRLNNKLSYQEMAEEIRPLGITISQQTIDELEAYDAEYRIQYSEDYYVNTESNTKIIDLLYWEGIGIYDSENGEWTPSDSGIFWFDIEVWDASAIYSNFFRGLNALHPEVNFTNVQEDYSRVDTETGIGTVGLSFDLNGKHYEMDARYYYDWFDQSILFEILSILRTDENPENLYYVKDGQAVFLYYGSTKEVKQLERKTGLDFSDARFIFS